MTRTAVALEPWLERLGGVAFVDAVQVVEAAAAEATQMPGHGAEARIVLETPSGKHSFLVATRSTALSYALADRFIHRVGESGRQWILFLPAISAAMGRHLAGGGVNFFDLQGNCSLRIGRKFLVQVEGRRPERREPQHKGIRAPGYQVLFALLAERSLIQAPIRTIAQSAGTSRQAVVDMLGRLSAERSIVGDKGKRMWVEHRLPQALDRWLLGYADVLRPKMIMGTFRTPDREPEPLEKRIHSVMGGLCEWRWTGSTAGYQLTGQYRGGVTTVLVRDAPADLPRRLQALPSREPNLVLMQGAGPIAFEGATAETAHPLLVYSEMVTEGSERSREAARELLDIHLDLQ